VEELRQGQEQIMDVVAENQIAIRELGSQISGLEQRVVIQEFLAPGMITAELNGMYYKLRDALEVAVHTVQQAHHRRLAIDFLSPENLVMLFEDLSSVAKDRGFYLLTQRPSDLLQLEVSYLYDGNDVLILLHVPMTAEDSLLRLFRLRPFPIPISDTHSLLPRVPTSVLALSKSKNGKRLMTTVEHADLLGCHQIGKVYTCDRHGALRRDIKSHCLGALYEQDIAGARKLCDLEVVPRKEAVLQLEGSWFLVYSTRRRTAYVTCQNGTSSEEYFKREIRRVHVSPGCRLELDDHSLHAEFSLYLESNVRHIIWEREDLSLFGLNENEFVDLFESAINTDRGLPLNEIVKERRSRKFATDMNSISSRTLAFYILIGVCSFVGLMMLTLSSLGARLVTRFREKIRRLQTSLAAMIPSLAEQLNRILTRLQLPLLPIHRFHLYPAIPVVEPPLPGFEPPPPFAPMNPENH